jgi:hypothetical protein
VLILQSVEFGRRQLRSERCSVVVLRCWAEYEPRLLNYAYLTLFSNYNKILACDGMKGYKIGHMGKHRLERAGLLPTVIKVVDPDLVEYDDVVINDGDGVNAGLRIGEVGVDESTIWVVPPLRLLGIWRSMKMGSTLRTIFTKYLNYR